MSAAEKQPLTRTLPPPIASASAHRQQPSLARQFLFRLAIFYVFFRLLTSEHIHRHIKPHLPHRGKQPSGNCVQFEGFSSNRTEFDAKDEIFSAEYRTTSVGFLSGLVQIRRESFDDNGAVSGPDADPRWNVFNDVAAYLNATFPLFHEKVKLEKVNTHGLLYTWTGTDKTLKPVLLMAHQDTVPINPATLSKWTHPPLSGYYDGTYIWGRGASDCGNTLIGTLEAATLLLEKDFVPTRTILFAFGFDEESKGLEGAGHIAPVLEERYGKDGIEFVVDEGGLGVGEMYGAGFASPSTSEKGYLDVKFTLSTPGGHSSVPPPHTGIGMMSQILTALESSPYSPSISLSSPIYNLLQCAAEHGTTLPKSLVRAVDDGGKNGKKGEKGRAETARLFAELDPVSRYLVTTSQAVDVIIGGVKVNALPELVSATVNYRVSVDSMPHVVREKIIKIVSPLAKKFGLEINAFGQSIDAASKDGKRTGGVLDIVGINELNPAPVSPTNSSSWSLLSSTIQTIYSSKFPNGLTVAPSIMTGNTDTRFMWSLSKNIYRFTPMDRKEGGMNIHTIDERVRVQDHVEAVWFFYELMRNVQEWEF